MYGWQVVDYASSFQVAKMSDDEWLKTQPAEILLEHCANFGVIAECACEAEVLAEECTEKRQLAENPADFYFDDEGNCIAGNKKWAPTGARLAIRCPGMPRCRFSRPGIGYTKGCPTGNYTSKTPLQGVMQPKVPKIFRLGVKPGAFCVTEEHDTGA